MPSPVSTRFFGLQIPIDYRHQCERQTDSDIDPKVVRYADVGGILIENEQIHSEKSLLEISLTKILTRCEQFLQLRMTLEGISV
jgi:hypothetical protein